MRHIVGMNKNGEIVGDLDIEQVPNQDLAWYWVDFTNPSPEEINFLTDKFKFHKLAVKDCLMPNPHPKIDFYGNYNFMVMHSLALDEQGSEEIHIFISPTYIVTFHHRHSNAIERARSKLIQKHTTTSDTVFTAYLIMDEIVDDYFPTLIEIEDRLSRVEAMSVKQEAMKISDEVYDIRSELLRMRRIIHPMRDYLLYRIVKSERMNLSEENRLHFLAVYDHLQKLSDKIADDREITADIIKNVDSMLSHRANELSIKNNNITLILTLISVIFLPLTYIVGVYGMNFDFMPELHWKFGYAFAWMLMVTIVVAMVVFFKKKKWME